MERRLYRSRSERIIWGVCGGLAQYFNIDPVIVRIVFALLLFADGIGLIAYIIMAIIIPLEGTKAANPQEAARENIEEMKKTATDVGERIRAGFGTSERAAETERSHQLHIWIGLIIILVGIITLLSTLDIFWWFRWAYLWPAILIVVGLIILLGARRK